jgi:hypothetical protein
LSVSRIDKHNGEDHLQEKAARGNLHSKRHNKLVSGHHVKVNVRLPLLKELAENAVKHFKSKRRSGGIDWVKD